MIRNFKYAVSLAIVVAGCLLQTSCNSENKDQNSNIDSTQNLADSSVAISVKAFDESFKKFAFIIDNQYLVLSDSVNDSWSTTAPTEYAQGNSAYYTSASVNPEILPEVYKATKNMEFAVYSVSGEHYAAKVVGYEIVSIEIPHFGAVQQWNGEQGEEAMSNSAIAQSIWDGGKHFLVAKLSISDSPAEELCFAVQSQHADVKIYDTISYNVQTVIDALGQTGEYLTKQREYEEASGSKNNWWDEAGSASIVTSVKNARNEVFTIISESAGEMCGGPYYFEFTSVWCTRNGSPALKKMNIDQSFTLVAVIDIDGDDMPEYVVDDGFGGRYLLSINDIDLVFKIPYHDCPC